MDFVRPDYLFSYWVLTWFLIYYFFPIPPFFKKYANPLLALCFALVENILQFVYFLYFHLNIWIIIYFLSMMLFVKVLPIYLLSPHNIIWRNDIFVLFFVFSIYNFYLFLNGTNVIDIYRTTIKSIQNGENKTPLFYLFSLIAK